MEAIDEEELMKWDKMQGGGSPWREDYCNRVLPITIQCIGHVKVIESEGDPKEWSIGLEMYQWDFIPSRTVYVSDNLYIR